MKWRWCFLILLSAAVFLPMLGRRDIVTSHEARVAQVARVMAASGPPWAPAPVSVQPAALVMHGSMERLRPIEDAAPVKLNPWLVPILNDEIRLQKPPLPYWCAALLMRWTGPTEWAARFVPALLAALATLLLFDVARQTIGRSAGWCAAIVWATTYFNIDAFRKAMADPYLAFFTLLCVWAWVRASRRVSASVGWLWLFYASVGLGILAKGPLILLTDAIPLLVYHLCLRRRVPRGWIGHLGGVVLVLAIALPWGAYVVLHVPHVVDIWKYESIGELSQNVENPRPWWFYFPNVPLLTLPWVAAAAAGVVYPFLRRSAAGASRKPRTFASGSARRALFPLIWFAASVVIFSCVNQKKNQYLMPTMPAEAMIAGVGLAAVLSSARKVNFKGTAGAVIAAQTCLGIGTALALPLLLGRQSGHYLIAAVVGVVLLGLSVWPLWAMSRAKPRQWLIIQAIAYAALLHVLIEGYQTDMDNSRSFRPLAATVICAAESPHHTLMVIHVPEEAAWYLPLSLQYNPFMPHVVVVLDTQGALRNGKPIPPAQVLEPDDFAHMFPDGRVVSVSPIALPAGPENKRWKAFDLTVDRSVYAADR